MMHEEVDDDDLVRARSFMKNIMMMGPDVSKWTFSFLIDYYPPGILSKMIVCVVPEEPEGGDDIDIEGDEGDHGEGGEGVDEDDEDDDDGFDLDPDDSDGGEGEWWEEGDDGVFYEAGHDNLENGDEGDLGMDMTDDDDSEDDLMLDGEWGDLDDDEEGEELEDAPSSQGPKV